MMKKKGRPAGMSIFPEFVGKKGTDEFYENVRGIHAFYL